MLITYCNKCGILMQLNDGASTDTAVCADCLAGKKRKATGRRGDSALLRRRSTSRMLKITKPPAE